MVPVVRRYLVEKLAVNEGALPAVTVRDGGGAAVVPSGELVVHGVVAEGLARRPDRAYACCPAAQAKLTGVR